MSAGTIARTIDTGALLGLRPQGRGLQHAATLISDASMPILPARWLPIVIGSCAAKFRICDMTPLHLGA